MLVSREEQWGLVVNEALALGVPAIVSKQVGSRDALVRNGVNGVVVDSESVAEIADALAAIASDEARWRAWVARCHARSWLGDTGRLADAVEVMLGMAGPVGPYLSAFLGAVVLLAIVNLIRRGSVR